MTFRNFEGWTTPCPECEFINIPHEGHVDKKDRLVLRFICEKCEQKYERREQLNQVSVVQLKNFRMAKPKWY